VQVLPQKFWFVENPGKIPENLGKILEQLWTDAFDTSVLFVWSMRLADYKRRSVYFAASSKISVGTISPFELYLALSTYKDEFMKLAAWWL